MATQIKIRRDSYANWFNVNPTLGIGEPGYDTTNRKLKIGDGTTLWRALSYFDDQVTDLSAYAGDIVPSVDVSQSIGSPAKRWQKGFFSGNAVYLGDIKLSNNNGTLVVQRVTNAGLSNEAAVPSTPGSVTTDRLVNGASFVSLLANGSIVTPAFTIPSTPGTSGQVLKWPGIGSTLVWGPDNNSGTGGGVGANVSYNEAPPVAPSLGDLWYDPVSGRTYIYYDSNWIDASPASSFRVESVTAGAGLSGGTITSSGTIAIANTTVTAGSYTLANITVNARGQITSASNGTLPTFATVATSGSYVDLTNKPTIPAAQIQSDWTQASNVALDFIKNKPTLFSGSYADLTNKPTIPSLTGYATETYVTTRGYLTSVGTISYTDLSNKPTIPAAQVQSDWNAISGLGVVLNKPTLFDGVYSSLSGKPTLFSGSYTDLTDKPAIPAAYSATSINALSDVDTATNVPTAGQPLVWNAVSSSWVPGSIVAASLSTLSGVTITSPAPGQVLKYNGSIWINDVDAVSGGAGVGSVTNVSVASANGFAGSVATASSTPDITISTSITGILRGTGIAITAATSGTDFAPGTSALTTGIVKSTTTTGALSIAVAGTDYQAPIGTITGLVKGNGANALTAAVTGTDYQAPIGTISGIVKGNGANALTAAINGTDYAPGTSTLTTGIVKSTTTTGALSIAVADTDYQTPVSATGMLKSSGVSGNVSAAVAGTDYQAPIGTISGIVKGNGANALTAAVAGTDYQAPITLTTTGSSGAATFSSNTLNIPQYTGGATAFSGLSDATSAALTVDEIYLQAITRLIVTPAGDSSSYSFDQYATPNPTIYAISGTTIAFDLAAVTGSHPFLIQTSGGVNYDTGLVHVSTAGVVSTGTNAQGKTSGTLYWKIPNSITGNYKYRCSVHSGMAGVIVIQSPTSPTFTGTVTLQQSTEVLNTKTAATGTVAHDLSTGAIFYHSSISANFTANFTNVPTTDNRTLAVVLVLSQGATARIPSAVQIDSVAQTIRWQGAVLPVGTASRVDVVSFTLIRTGSAWTVIGALTTYGAPV